MSSPIRIRPMSADDLDDVFQLQLDPESNRMAVTIPRTAEAFDAHWRETLGKPDVHAYMILLDERAERAAERAQERAVGYISCFSHDGHDEVGYWIDRNFWGRGIATQALRCLLDAVPVRPMRAITATSNPASMQVLKKCGFQITQVEWSPASDRYPECEIAIHILSAADTNVV